MIKKYVNVEGHPELVRDVSSNAVINNNTTAYQEYIETAKKVRQKQQTIDRMIDEVAVIKNDMAEIKLALQLLLQQNKT